MTIKYVLEENDIIKLIAEHYKIDEVDINIYFIKKDTPRGLVEYVEATFTKECSNVDAINL